MTDRQLEHRHIRLTRDRRKSKIQVGACRHLTIAGHIPCGRHDDATGQRIGDRRNVLCCELEGFGVHADLRVCQVTVVQQNQLGTSKARGSRNNGACAGNIELLPEDLLQRTIFSGRVTGDGHAVRAQRGTFREGFLHNSEFGDCAVVVDVDFGAEQGHACFFQPDLRPCLEVTA